MTSEYNYIINVTVEYFAANNGNNAFSKEGTNVISQFLQNDNLAVLIAAYNKNKKTIQFQLSMKTDKNECLLFYKIPKSDGETYKSKMVDTSDDMKRTIGILTLEGGFIKSIYNSVSRIFLPEAETDCNAEFSGWIQNLHEALSSVLDVTKTDMITISDEIKFWQMKLKAKSTAIRLEERTAIETTINNLESMAKQLLNLGKANGTTIEEFLASTHNNLDAIWRLQHQYPQQRMAALMNYIGSQLIDLHVKQLLNEDIWSLHKPLIKGLLSQCIDTMDSWLELCDSLTRLFWPNYGQHPWCGEIHVPKCVLLFKERISEIQNIKELFEQITTLTGDLNIQEFIQTQTPFKEFDVFDITSKGRTKWLKAVEQFEHMLQPIDERIAEAIKNQLHRHFSNGRQLIHVVSRYATLIQRPVVFDFLTIELEQFVQSLQTLVEDLRKSINTINMQSNFENLSALCNECRWLKIIQYEITQIEKISYLVVHCKHYDQLLKSTLDMKEDVESLLRKNFEIWCNKFSHAVQHENLKIEENHPVVEFEQGSRQYMRVTFNPKLITLCEDVREFENMGFTVPPDIRKATIHGFKYIGYARLLQQIACFYNTIGDRMIPCQRPIMLKNAREFSKLIHKDIVCWKDEKSVERYVNTLHNAVSQLLSHNNLLIRYHEEAKRLILKLMNIDLISQRQMWKDGMGFLRTLLASLEHQQFTNLDTFKLHWDHQFYKAAECQFILGLLHMNNKLPNIYIKIAFRHRELCFIPAEEEIRKEYFTQLDSCIKRFYEFRGLSDKSVDLYCNFIENNCRYFGPLYNKAAELFGKLSKFKNLWLPWVALGCVDISELCDIHLQTPESWEYNFQQCKYFSQQIAKLDNDEKCIECFVIDMKPLLSDIEDINRRYWQTLIHSLKSSIVVDINYVREFLEDALEFVQNISYDQSSITSINLKYEQIRKDSPYISKILDNAIAKNTCLTSWCKESISSLNYQVTQWEMLKSMLENHSVVFQRQLELMKTQAQGQLQNMKNEIEKFMLRWDSTIQYLETNETVTLDLMNERLKYWQDILKRKSSLIEECQKMNVELPQDTLYIFEEFDDKIKEQSKPWLLYDEYLCEFATIEKEEWTIYRGQPCTLQKLINKWDIVIRDIYDEPSKRIRCHIELLKRVSPILHELQSEALTERHWMDIFNKLAKETYKAVHEITLKDILDDMPLLEKEANEIYRIVRQASKEQVIRQALNELDRWSVTAYFKTFDHQATRGDYVTLIKDYTEIINKIYDNQSLLQSVKKSDISATFMDSLELWDNKLNNLNTILNALNQSQKRWIYLEPIFGAGTLCSEEALFKQIDKEFRFIMNEVKMDSHVVSLMKINNISSNAIALENQLKRCQINLMSYITEKRNLFPRFYFMSDDDLLELLGQGNKTPEVIQKHINKILPGCHALNIVTNTINSETVKYVITNLISLHGDILKLNQSVEIAGNIENWLNNVVITMQNTLREQIFECCNTYYSEGFEKQTLEQYVEQVLLITRAIQFTKQVENCIQAISLPNLLQQLNKEMARYANWKCDEKRPSSQNPLTQRKLRAIMYDLANYITIVKRLIKHNVMHINSWYWLSQLKFYMSGENANLKGQVFVRMAYGEFEYSYEFLGNPDKLIHTRLTQKCYLTLTQAMQMGLGGNPFGPAGTGKTECIKALGAMLGRYVLIFNCDENVDTNSMASILIGLTRCGAWGCFDEFNRLQEVTLSSISMLIQPIQAALRDKCDTVLISDIKVNVNQNCGIFVTLNPAGTEYGGRKVLPKNLQALFRPIAMEQPEKMEIARVMLSVEGFKTAKEIAERILELYDMCSKMLTQQRHYDWGLRELKTVLLACSKDAYKKLIAINENSNSTSNNVEMKIIYNALYTSIKSKLVYEDITAFNILLRNIFPDVEGTSNNSDSMKKLQECITEAFNALGLLANDKQLEKVLELYDHLQKRMGVVIMGPPGCGKTTIITLLKEALSKRDNREIRIYTISPKSMSRRQLLGYLDTDTRQWFDGILTYTSNVVNNEPNNIYSWIVCDGSIDPQWIEALNSVLDDNRLLSLPSGWRIQFGNNVNFIFETDNVRNASPATISRIGIVNISLKDYPLKSIIKYKLAKYDFDEISYNFLEELYEPIMTKLENEFSTFPFTTRAHMMHALILKLHEGNNGNTKIESREQFALAISQVIWNYMLSEQYNEWITWLFDKTKIFLRPKQKPELLYFNKNTRTVESYEDDDAIEMLNKFKDDLYQTASVKMYLNQLQGFLNDPKCCPFLLVGPSGSGKTLLLQTAINKQNDYDLLMINCSSQLNTTYIIDKLRQNLNLCMGQRGQTLKAKRTRLVMYLKNLDLCALDAWNCNSIVELLLQLVQRNGFYYFTKNNEHATTTNANNLEWVYVSDLQICFSISVTTWPAHSILTKISSRYLAINHILHIKEPSNADMLTVLQWRFSILLTNEQTKKGKHYFNNTVRQRAQVTSEFLLRFYNELQAAFSKINSNANIEMSSVKLKSRVLFYQFSSKLLLKVLTNLTYYPENAFNEALWCELFCLFGDRMVSEEDMKILSKILKRTFSEMPIKENIHFVTTSTKPNNILKPLSHEEWRDDVQKHLIISNSENFAIDAPLTSELLELIAKLNRLIARPNTHILLIGPAGGRQMDAIYLAASIQQLRIHLLNGDRNYGLQEFYNDLKLLIQSSVLENQYNCLVIEQNWLIHLPELMKPIDALLGQSEMLDLFDNDLESIIASLKQQAHLENYQDNLISFFMKRVQQNLHLIICLDSDNAKTNELLDQYPTLYRYTEIIYIKPLSQKTCTKLPEMYIEHLKQLSTIRMENIKISKCFNKIIDFVVLDKPPLKFYQLIKTYYYVYEKSFTDNNKRLIKLQNGVDKLRNAYDVVDSLKEKAVQQENILAEKRQLAKDALNMISSTMKSANSQKSNMLDLKKQTQLNSEKLKKRHKEIQDELAEVKPILEEASSAVAQIKSEALSEIRSLRAPPEIIRDILEGVLRLMGVKDTSWNSMKTFLAKRGVKEDIRSLDPSRINPENCAAVEKLLTIKAESFEEKKAKRASSAAAPLAAWVKASVRYSKVLQSIKPLEKEQIELQNDLEMAELKMQSIVTGLDDVDNRVEELSNKLNAYTQEAAVLEVKLNEAHETLKNAEILLQQLNTEYNTWNLQLTAQKQLFDKLDDQSLLISLILNYYFYLSHIYKSVSLNQLVSKLKIIDIDGDVDTYDIRSSLITEQEQFIWESMGLIKDTQIIESASILAKIIELPFGIMPIPIIVDPTETAINWLKEYLKLKERNFEIIAQNNPRLTYTLELAIRFGKVLILQNYEELKPPLMQFVTHKMYVKYSKKQLDVAGKLIDLDESFQLIFVTKSTRLESQSYLNIIPFTITTNGLCDQLMSQAIKIKNPSLEEKRIELLRNEGVLLKKRLCLEDELLKELSQAEGDILQNEKLLKTLHEIKQSTFVIDNSIQESTLIRQTILQDHNFLYDICYKAADFYITLIISYNLCCEMFVRLFSNLLEDSCDIAITTCNTKNQEKFHKNLVIEIFQYMARSFDSESHLPLALYICRCAFKESIPEYEWQLFVTNFAETNNEIPHLSKTNQISKIFDEEKILKLSALIDYNSDLAVTLQLHNTSLWLDFLNGVSREIPVILSNHFENLLLTQIMRPDLMTYYMRLMLEHLLNVSIEIQRQPTIEQIISESINNDKAILILTKGDVDPTAEIYSVACKNNNEKTFQELAVGEGMENKLWEVLREASQLGKWLCLKNVHLIPEWLKDLSIRLKELEKSPSFRLWLISESTNRINEDMKSQFITILYENSIGIKQKTKKLFQKYVHKADGDISKIKDPKLMKMRVALFILIAVLQERCRYIPQGWSQYYDFGEADIKVSLQLTKWFDKCLEGNRTDWTIIQKLYKYVSFGGHINNSRDLLILQNYLEKFFCNNMFNSRWTPFDNKVIVPTASQWLEYLNILNKIPIEDKPEILKLSPKLCLHKELQYGEKIIKILRDLSFNTLLYQEESLQKLEVHVKPILTLWRKLASSSSSNVNSLLHGALINKTTGVASINEDATTPWLLFLNSELKVACQGYNLIHNTLSLFYDMLKSKKCISRDIYIANTISTYQVPTEWQRSWSGPINILDYLKAFMKRALATERRYQNCQQMEFAAEIDLSTVFYSHTLLAALKLLTSQTLHMSCKELVIDSQCVLHSNINYEGRSNIQSPFVCLLEPLLLDGAVFSNDKIMVTSNGSEGQESTTSPKFIIYFVERKFDDNNKILDNCIELPVYTNKTRREILCELKLPTKETKDTVLLSGAALYVADY